AVARDLTLDEIAIEIERRRTAPAEPGEPSEAVAHRACVIAELKRRVGDSDADDWYERAIAADPAEPGYELWYGSYLGTARGAAGPIVEAAETHYYRAIEKLDRRRRDRPLADYEELTGQWTQRRLLDLYQRDGAPIVGWKAYQYDARDLALPGVLLSSTLEMSADTRDFYHGNEMRLFTGEAAFAASTLRLGRPLSNTERFELIRAPLRTGWNNRVRLRHNWIGALDLEYRWFQAKEAQIGIFTEPNKFVDLEVNELGVGYSRELSIGSLFDLDLRGNVRRIHRTGTVEFLPELTQAFTTYEVTPTVSRFIGPDKLSLRGTYVYMAVPDVMGGAAYERARGQTIRALHVEYAIYRAVRLPSFDGGLHLARRYTRGWHWYAGIAEDSQIYGLRQVGQRDHYAGTSLKGLGAYDVTLQGTIYTAKTEFVDPAAPQMGLQEDQSQHHSQYRTTFALSRRLIDEDITPGLPSSRFGFAPASLVLVVPVSHDTAISGSSAFENVRAGAELWLKLIGTGLGGTTFLITGGYDYQFFYRESRAMHMAHLAVRMGW
ncbi:MAG: hypothetical protein H7138_12270, partial [Myxococcales bacterium]|nr:hypothetical protein [Myxococcales bacterium]